MYTSLSKKTLSLCILDILKKYSDDYHRLSQKDICDFYSKEYSEAIDRRTVGRHLTNLIDYGFDIGYREISRPGKSGENADIRTDFYFMRDFTDSELRLIIDSLLFSKHIPNKQRNQLIKKLSELSNKYFKTKVGAAETTMENRELFYIIEVLDEAISTRKQVLFRFNSLDVDKKLHPILGNDGTPKEYTVSPYQMAAANGKYYLICGHENSDKLYHYRIDRITNIQISNKPTAPLKGELRLEKYMMEHIYMFGGDSAQVRFRAERRIVGDILDWFGDGVSFSEVKEDMVTAAVQVNKQAMVYWALQYGQAVEVLKPDDLREEIRAAIRKMGDMY